MRQAQKSRRRPIYPKVLYPLADISVRAGLSIAAFHELHANGRLRLKKAGNTYYVLGGDYIAYVSTRDAIPRRRGVSAPEDNGASH